MSKQVGSTQALNADQLLHLHNLTKDVSKLCENQLRVYLDALAPLFRPRRILGDYIEGSGRESVVGAEQNLLELRELFYRVCGRPFDLRKELATPLESIFTQIQLHHWEYLHEVQAGSDRKTITVTSPLTWVLSYPSTHTLSMLRQVIAGKLDRDTENIRAFALRACVMYLMFQKLATLSSLFEGLRFRVEVRKSPQLGELPS